MKFTEQNKFDDEGNCLEACISSLVGMDINSFPADLCKKVNWVEVLNSFLIDNHNIYIDFVSISSVRTAGVVIAIIQTAASDEMYHAVLWDVSENCVIFDPSPVKKSLKGNPVVYGIVVNYYENRIREK